MRARRPRRNTTLAGLVLALVAIAPGLAHAAPGDLDPSFSGNGRLVLHNAGGISSVVVTRHDSLVAAIRSRGPRRGGLVRLDQYGTPDPSFGSDGFVATPYAGQVAVQRGRGILTASAVRAGIERFRMNGQVDRTFGNNGVAQILSVEGVGAAVDDLAVGPSGEVVAVGEGRDPNNEFSYLVVGRFLPDGRPDATFGDNGRLVFDPLQPGGFDFPTGVTVQSDGAIVVSMIDDDDVGALLRIRPSGELDPTFGVGGSTSLRLARKTYLLDVSLQGDGRILAAGWSRAPGEPHDGFLIARYGPDGSLDPTFSGDGVLIDAVGGSDPLVRDVLEARDGSIVAIGEAGAYDSREFAVARYTHTGRPELDFGVHGVARTVLGSQGETQAYTGAIDSEGRIVAAGEATTRSYDEGISAAVARFRTGGLSSDADADGAVDRIDRCIQVQGRRHGCPAVRGKVTLRYSSDARHFVGQLDYGDGNARECNVEAGVELWRRGGRRDRLIGAGHTSPGGVWAVHSSGPPGTYFARVTRHLRPSVGICEPRNSPMLALGPRRSPSHP
jgi:uncharacterized delta-60 repeat protein